jgi:hypothetical protein
MDELAQAVASVRRRLRPVHQDAARLRQVLAYAVRAREPARLPVIASLADLERYVPDVGVLVAVLLAAEVAL